MSLLTTEIFIEKSNTKHNNFYIYDKSIYKNARTKIKIKCKFHGYFEQIPHQHILGKGCAKCGKMRSISKASHSTNDFIKKSKEIHGELYDYSKSIYINGSTKVIIICKEHGEFLQRPKDHIYQKSGCKTCSHTRTSNINRTSIDDFISKANSIHGNKYDYSNVKFESLKDKITIVCNDHGKFKQNAGSHIQGHGCSKCSKTGFDKEKPAWLYFVYMKDHNLYKIGVTNRSIEQRLKNENHEILYSKYYNIGFDAYISEQIFIRNNIHLKYTGKKLMINGGNTELFKIGAGKDEHGKALKPDNWPEIEAEQVKKLQSILDKRA